MDNIKKESNSVDLETRTKKPGFFKRLKRGFTSIFQRKGYRKRVKSDPCLPDIKENDPQADLNNELRLSLSNNDQPPNGDNVGGMGEKNFRPPTKAPIFVNDFTAELKKSLKLRSKMVEEGQTSEAIHQIEMTRSNYSPTDDECQTEIEKKTFEEKLALFESQISGGSLQNSLNRSDKPVDSEHNNLQEDFGDLRIEDEFNLGKNKISTDIKSIETEILFDKEDIEDERAKRVLDENKENSESIEQEKIVEEKCLKENIEEMKKRSSFEASNKIDNAEDLNKKIEIEKVICSEENTEKLDKVSDKRIEIGNFEEGLDENFEKLDKKTVILEISDVSKKRDNFDNDIDNKQFINYELEVNDNERSKTTNERLTEMIDNLTALELSTSEVHFDNETLNEIIHSPEMPLDKKTDVHIENGNCDLDITEKNIEHESNSQTGKDSEQLINGN